VFRGKEDESMVPSNLRRGLMAVVFVAALTVAGARPAAAEGLGWRQAWDWLSGLWGGVTLQAGGCGLEIDPSGCPKHSSSADTVDVVIDPSGGPTTNSDCGLEIDPNGVPRCKPTGTASGG
jgi:hypothetical protein